MRAPVASHVLLSEAMRAVRQHLGIAQPALAHRMRCTRSRVSQFENAHELPSEQGWETWLRAVGEAARSKPRQPEWTAALREKVAEAKRLYAQACVEQLRAEGVRVLLGPGEFEPHEPHTGDARLDDYPLHVALDGAEQLVVGGEPQGHS